MGVAERACSRTLGFLYACLGCAELQDLLPGIINQLGPDNLSHLKKIAQQVSPTLPFWCLAHFLSKARLRQATSNAGCTDVVLHHPQCIVNAK